MGIQAHNSATFLADDDDIKAGSQAFAAKVSARRRQAAHCTLDVAESASADESMTESLEKSRKK